MTLLLWSYIIFSVLIFLFANRKELFVTEKNKKKIQTMSCIYNTFTKKHPNLQIIETINVSDDHKYNIKAYDKEKNTVSIYELSTNSEKLIGVPFLLNEYDTDLNKLEKSKELVSIKEYIRRY